MRRRRTMQHRLMAAVAVLTGVAFAPTLADAEPPVPWSAPTFERTFSGPSRPGVAAWGLAHNPVTDEFIVGDYASNQVRRFARDGSYLGDLVNPGLNTEGVVSSVAVDHNDGSIYVSTTSFTATYDVRKYDPAGNFLFGVSVSSRVAWMDIGPDGDLWYADAYGGSRIYRYEIDDVAQSATQIVNFRDRGTGVGQVRYVNGVAVDSSNRVFAADTINRKVVVYDAAGGFLYEFGDDTIFDGDMRGIDIDEVNGLVYVVDAASSEVEVFTIDGVHVASLLGDRSAGPGGFPGGGRQIAVTPDGNFWVADFAAWRVQGFTPTGELIGLFPDPPMTPDVAGMVEPWGLEFDDVSGQVFVADKWGQRVTVFDADGDLLDTFGTRGTDPASNTNYPTDVFVDPDTGWRWVQNDEGQPWLVAYDDQWNVRSQIVTKDLATGIDVVGDTIWVSRRAGIEAFDKNTGIRTVDWGRIGGVAYGGIGVDTTTGLIWVPRRDDDAVLILNPDGSQHAEVFTAQAGTDVAFDGPYAYVTDTADNRVFVFDRATLASVGTFGSTGSGPGQLRGPRGIDVGPDGRIYVVEERGQRISVFTYDAAPAVETNTPTGWIEAPDTDTLPLTATGRVQDDTAIATVEVAIEDLGTGRFYNANEGTWAGWNWNQAVLTGPRTDAAWRFVVPPSTYGQQIKIRARFTDVHGNVTWRNTTVTLADSVAPAVAITTPTPGATVQPGTIDVAGTASDDGQLSVVDVALEDPASGEFFDPLTGTFGAEVWTRATLTGTDWSTAFAGGSTLANGALRVHARGIDAAGNVGLAAPVDVTIGGDTTPPETVLTSLIAGQQYEAPVVPAGTVADNVAVDRSQWALKDLDAGLWYDAATDVWQGTFVFNEGVVGQVGAPTTIWQAPSIDTAGVYHMQFRAWDAAGNVQPVSTKVWFRVVAAADAPPTTTVDSHTTGDVVFPGSVLSGTADDDNGVATVGVAIKDRATNEWWNAATDTWGAFVRNPAVLTPTTGNAVDWSLTLPTADREMYVSARATDTAGAFDPASPWLFLSAVTDSDGFAAFQTWPGFGGTRLTDIPVGTAAATNELVDVRAGLSINTSQDSFGGRVRVVVTPDETGDYTFWLASDDNGSLRIDPAGTDPAALTEIASVPGWSSLNQWDKYPEQQSATIALTAGESYLVEAIFKEGGGGDHVAIAWQPPSGSGPTVIPGSFVAPGTTVGGWDE